MQSMNRFVCSKCGKELANRHNLSRHKKNCRSIPYNIAVRSPIIDVSPTFDAVKRPVGDGAAKEPNNPKIQALLDEIVNDDHDMDVSPTTVMKPAATSQAIPKKMLPIVSQKNLLTDVNMLPNLPPAIVA